MSECGSCNYGMITRARLNYNSNNRNDYTETGWDITGVVSNKDCGDYLGCLFHTGVWGCVVPADVFGLELQPSSESSRVPPSTPQYVLGMNIPSTQLMVLLHLLDWLVSVEMTFTSSLSVMLSLLAPQSVLAAINSCNNAMIAAIMQ